MEEQHHSNSSMLIAALFAALVFGGLGYWLGTSQLVTDNTSITTTPTETITTTAPTATNTPSTQATTSPNSISLETLQKSIDPSKEFGVIERIYKTEGDFILAYESFNPDGGSMIVIKNINGNWTLVWKGQELACSAVDEYEIPSSFYRTCYESDLITLRQGNYSGPADQGY